MISEMPHIIISTVALLANLYKNAPLIVGDKDSDPDLMRFLGARMTTNYPACGSPPMYVMHAPPRTVFDNLEKRGYCLMSAQTIQEHSVWILARPRVPADDKVEISRGGPNDKSIQAFEEPNDAPSPTPSRTPSGNRSRSPSKNPRIKITRSSSKQTLNEDITLNITESQKSSPNEQQSFHSGSQKLTSEDGDARPASHDSWRSRDKSPNNVTFSVQFRESSPRQKSTHRTRKILENQKLSVEIIENEPRRRKSHRVRKILDLENPRSRSVSPEKKGTRETSPNSQSLTLQPNNLRLSVQVRDDSTKRKSTPVKEIALYPAEPNKSKEPMQQAEKQKGPHKERTWTRRCCDNDTSFIRAVSPVKRIEYLLYEDNQLRESSPLKDEKHSFGEEDSQKILPNDQKDPGNVTSRGDAGTYLLESEKVHMGIQASDSEVMMGSDVMSRSTFNARNHSELLKNSIESTDNQPMGENNKIKPALKRTLTSSKQIQADIDSDLNIKPRKTGINVHFANSKNGLGIGTPLKLDSSIPDVQGIIDLYSLAGKDTDQNATTSGSHFRSVEESTLMNEGTILQNSVILRSLASRCSHIAIVDDVDSPMVIDITDPTIRSCLTHENCCCEDS